MRQLKIGAGLLHPRLVLALLRLQHGELVLLGGERGAALRQRCLGFAGIGLRLLEALAAGEVAGHQGAVPLVILLCSGQIGLGGFSTVAAACSIMACCSWSRLS